MENQTYDFLCKFGTQDGSMMMVEGTLIIKTQHVLSSASQVPTLAPASSAQIVNPQTTPPLRVMVDSQPVSQLRRVLGKETYPDRKRTFKKEKKQHFRHVYKGTPDQFRLCNRCHGQHPATKAKKAEKIAKKKAREEAEAAAEKKARKEAEAAEKEAREEAMCALKL